MNQSLRVPAEWEPLQCVWLSWPHNPNTWPGFFPKIPPFYSNWVRRIAESTPIRILVTDSVAKQCESLVGDVPGVDIVDIPTNDAWVRDYGPTFVLRDQDTKLHGVDWQYNAWGGKYPPWDLDNAAAKAVCGSARIGRAVSQLCVEGGALEFDGLGRVLTTPCCLITETRNPGWSKEAISQELHTQTGVTEIVWLDGGTLEGDDTDGHIDQIARFVDAKNVVAAVSGDDKDPNHPGLQNNFAQLHLWGDATTPRVTIHRLPLPPARFIENQRVPESYCNFLRLGKERMLVPTFGAASDNHALGLLREISGAEVEGIDCRDLIWGLGALHCASRDQPANPK